MLVLYTPFEGLLNTSAAEWERVRPRSGQSLWQHPNGLQLAVKRGLRMPHTWDVVGTRRSETMDFIIPRTHRDALKRDITPLLTDIQAWIPSLDLEPVRHIAHQLEAWLVLHNRTGTYTFTLNRETGIFLRPGNLVQPRYRMNDEPVPVPEALAQAMQPDIQKVWSRRATPSSEGLHRRWALRITPLSGHARLHLLASARPEVQSIPPPPA